MLCCCPSYCCWYLVWRYFLRVCVFVCVCVWIYNVIVAVVVILFVYFVCVSVCVDCCYCCCSHCCCYCYLVFRDFLYECVCGLLLLLFCFRYFLCVCVWIVKGRFVFPIFASAPCFSISPFKRLVEGRTGRFKKKCVIWICVNFSDFLGGSHSFWKIKTADIYTILLYCK